LQYSYVSGELREEVFSILAEVLPEGTDGKGKVSADTGRPGMARCKILVLGTLRVGLNADYDRILAPANEHTTVRRLLGHGDWADERRYSLQALKENLRLLPPEILARINQILVRAGQQLVK
jgi:IS5 family transposase